MSKHDAAYIEKFQPNHPRNPEAPRTFERSECCKAPVTWARSRGSMYNPPEPYAVCENCGRKCSTVEVTEIEEETP